MECRVVPALVAAILALPAHAQTTVPLTVGERVLSLTIPSGFKDLATVSTGWVDQLFGFMPAEEQPLMVIVADEVVAENASWTSTSPYVLLSVMRHSLGGTMSGPEFAAQISFAVNGLRDASRLTEADAALLLADALVADDDTPFRFNPLSSLAISDVQLLEVNETGERAASLVLLHPTPENGLLFNDLGFVNVNGQMLKVSGFAVLRSPETLAGLEVFAKAVRDGLLAGN